MVISLKKTTGTTPEQLSDALTLPGAGGGTWLAQDTVTFAGQVITGGVLSSTKMVWIQVDVFPHPSVADHVLAIVRS